MANNLTLETSLAERKREALDAYRTFTGSSNGLSKPKKRQIKGFIQQYPDEAGVLASVYDIQHPNGSSGHSLLYRLNHVFDRLPNEEDKITQEIQDERIKGYGRIRKFISKHPKIVGALIGLQGVVCAMSPTNPNPFAVDSYLAGQAYNAITRNTPAINQEELEKFLTSKAQVERYRGDFIEDVKDDSSEKAFVVIRTLQGNLEQKSVRTLHENMPDWVPDRVRAVFDRHCMPRLDDLIEIERQGNEIVANGHYHVFGETPSRGDRLLQKATARRDVVVVNGLVPFIYVDSNLCSFNKDSEKVPNELYNLFWGLNGIHTNRDLPKSINESNISTFLSYLKQKYRFAINNHQQLGASICLESDILINSLKQEGIDFFSILKSGKKNTSLEIFISNQADIFYLGMGLRDKSVVVRCN